MAKAFDMSRSSRNISKFSDVIAFSARSLMVNTCSVVDLLF